MFVTWNNFSRTEISVASWSQSKLTSKKFRKNHKLVPVVTVTLKFLSGQMAPCKEVQGS